MKILRLAVFVFAIFTGFLAPTNFMFASSTEGIVDPAYKYAWGENVGWVNFGTENGDVLITDQGLSGYALSENVGWVNLNDIINNGEGDLSGYAWGENVGYIKFDPENGGVHINSNGEFSGTALGENIGWINFDTDYRVKTDWRPRSSRPVCNNAIDDDGDGKIDYPDDSGCSSLEDSSEERKIFSSGSVVSSGSLWSLITGEEENNSEEETKPLVVEVFDEAKEITEKIIDKIIPGIFDDENTEEEGKTLEEELSEKEIPEALIGEWNLLPTRNIGEFVLAPLPKEIQKLAYKIPEFGKTLKELGINKITDITKLKDVEWNLSGMSELKEIPTEVVFTQAGNDLIDFNVLLSLNDKGETKQTISSIIGQPIKLVIKPEHPVDSVKGYLVFKSNHRTAKSLDIPANSLLASALFSNPKLVNNTEPLKIEDELLLQEFEYTDPDGDGVYEAEINAPATDGEYEVITILTFKDPSLGSKEIRMTTIIDPEGYIYERDGYKETRIPDAVVSIYRFNEEKGEFELWDAEKYKQKNPQRTDTSGTYAFLVPEGKYYISVKAHWYKDKSTEIFEVDEGGNGVHMNIELKGNNWIAEILDWRTILLFVVVILLFYNFYRDRIKEKLFSKFKNYKS